MLDLLTGIPPIIHKAMATSNDALATWVFIGLIVALILVAMITLVIAAYQGVQKQTQMKEYEALPQPQGGEQPLVHAPEEEKIFLLR